MWITTDNGSYEIDELGFVDFNNLAHCDILNDIASSYATDDNDYLRIRQSAIAVLPEMFTFAEFDKACELHK